MKISCFRKNTYYRILATIGVITIITMLSSCAREIPGEPPPEQSFYFPIDIAIAPQAACTAYVLNSNFDLRYNSGWLSVVDLEKVITDSDQGKYNPKQAIVSQLNVLSLAGHISVHPNGRFAIITHRGDPGLSIVQITDANHQVHCGEQGNHAGLNKYEKKTDCDRAHIWLFEPSQNLEQSTFSEKLDFNEIADPFGVDIFDYTSGTGDLATLAAVSHLSAGRETGRLSFFRIQGNILSDTTLKLEPLRAVRLGRRTGVATVRMLPEHSGRFVVAASQLYDSESEPSTLYVFDVGRCLARDTEFNSMDDVQLYPTIPNNAGEIEAFAWPDHACVRARTINFDVGGNELLGIEFAPTGHIAYVVNRTPDTVVTLDTSLESIVDEYEPGQPVVFERPRFSVLDAAPVPNDPTGIIHMKTAEPDSQEMLVVASFEEDTLYLLKPQGYQLSTIGRIEKAAASENLNPEEPVMMGSGPYALASTTCQGRQLFLSTTFYDHGLSVYEIDNQSPTGVRFLAHIYSSATPKVDSKP